MSFSGKTVIIIGLGKSGTAAAKLLVQRGARVVAYDENPNAIAPFEHPSFEVRKGALPSHFWSGAAAVVVSPGVPLDKPELRTAREAGALMFGEIELAWRTMPAGAGPMLGITGTNGKSTTTALLGELTRQHFARTFVGGNLGTAFTLAYEDPKTPAYDVHVIELSSFQLEGMVEASCRGAAILNLTPDHLDRYATHEAYGEAKARIFRQQPLDGFAVVNADDAHVVRLSKRASVPVYAFTLNPSLPHDGFAGLAIGRDGAFSFTFGDRASFTVGNRALRGAHNVQNAMAASLMASLSGVPSNAIQRGLDHFPGLAHRLEFVSEINGVEWVNDSKATNVDSALVALAAVRQGVWLIAGGKGKGAPYEPLVKASLGKVKGVLTIGQDAETIAKAFGSTIAVHACGTLDRAVTKARALAERGDTVLLSPACASYDQFKHFEHRGDSFKSLVLALAEENRPS